MPNIPTDPKVGGHNYDNNNSYHAGYNNSQIRAGGGLVNDIESERSAMS